MKDEEEDKGARKAAGEMDDEKHGSVVKSNLPGGEMLNILFLMGLYLDAAAQKVEDRIVGENEERDQKERKDFKFGS
jgi:hypothetical protein